MTTKTSNNATRSTGTTPAGTAYAEAARDHLWMHFTRQSSYEPKDAGGGGARRSDCHGLQIPHPGDWLTQHPSTYNADPGLCSRCHTSSFCVDCHGVSLPHSASFIHNHFNYVYTNGAVCVKCHGNGGTGPNGCFGGDCHGKGSTLGVP